MGLKFLILVLLSIASSGVLAEWPAVKILISESWGEAENQFGILYEDTSDSLPGSYDISQLGNIVMADQQNGRFKIYGSNNLLQAIVVPPVNRSEQWTIAPVFVGEKISLILDYFYFYGLSGELKNTIVSPKKARKDQDVDNVLYLYQSKPIGQWVVYSQDGDMLDTSIQKPLVLGRISNRVFIYDNKKKYITTAEFDDAVWTLMGKYYDDCFQRDGMGHLYCVNDSEGHITRYNQCGKPVAKLTLPEDDITRVPSGVPGIEDQWSINSQYANPKIDTFGNVYATRRTPDNYSLVKWTWHNSATDKNDGPDAPINLGARQLDAGTVELDWEGSLQDPGCVSGYKVFRSEVSGSDGTEILSLGPGIRKAYDTTIEPGKTYYYHVQALSVVGNSDLSSGSAITIE